MRRSFRKLGVENLENRKLLAAAVLELDGVGYFVSSAAPLIQRYDISQEVWLDPIELAGGDAAPTAAEVDVDGIYVAYGSSVYRYDLSGESPIHLLNTVSPVRALHADGDILFINHSAGLDTKVTSIDKITDTVVDTLVSYLDVIGGSSIATEQNRIFGRSQGISPSDITYVSYDDSGNFLSNASSAYHGDFAGASRTWVFPDQRYVVDDSGNVYSTNSLTHSGRLGTGIDDIAFVGQAVPIVLSGTTLTTYSNALLPVGGVELANTAEEIFVNATNVLAFHESDAVPGGYSVEIISLDSLSAPEPSDSIDPLGLAFQVDDAEIANDGTVLLYSAERQSIFRWDPSTTTYTQSLRLIGTPSHVAYSDQLNTLYTAYPSGLIRKIDFESTDLREVPFANLPSNPLGLVTAGNYLIAEDGSGAWTTLNTIDSDGNFVDSKAWHYPSSELVWNDSSQEVLYLSLYSPSDLHARKINADGSNPDLVDGGIGRDRNTPLHGSELIQLPVRVSPDGRTAILGSGGVFDIATLVPGAHSLANTVADLTWIDDQLFSVRNIAGVAQVQAWSGATYELSNVRQFVGQAERLIAIRDDAMLLMTKNDGIPTFHLLDSDLRDIQVSDVGLQSPSITWNNPDPILRFDSLSEIQLDATSDVPGTMTYQPDFGTRLPAGTHELSVTLTPDDGSRYRSVTKTVSVEVFGIDFGDAPDATLSGFAASYPVALADDGARHVLRGPLSLGRTVEAELDGVPTDPARGGDNPINDDEDGVRVLATVFSLGQASSSSLEIDVMGQGKVNAWIDFNRDGDWDDDGEQVATDVSAGTGSLVIPFDVPTHLQTGYTMARVRLNSSGGLSPTGLAEDGEVEDHVVLVVDPGEAMTILPVSLAAMTVETDPTQVIYRQSETILASYPLSLLQVHNYAGHDGDDTVVVPAEFRGEMILTGDAGPGYDQIVVSSQGQNLNLVSQPSNTIRNVEMIDLRGHGANRLTLDAASSMRLRGEQSPLKIVHQAVDQLMLEGEWMVDPVDPATPRDYHTLRDGDAILHIVNEHPHRNPMHVTDVDADGKTVPLDVLLIINHLRSAALDSNLESTQSSYYVDVNGDNRTTPLDALLVINELRRASIADRSPIPIPIAQADSSLANSWFAEDDENEEPTAELF